MQPIGPLMHEHRLIERMIALLDKERKRIDGGDKPDILFLHTAVDFIRTYADACHHGKEEDILFRELENKDLTQEQKTLMDELVQDHVYGRELVGTLAEAVSSLAENGDSGESETIVDVLGKLVEFYPAHIEKEDERFFHPVMEYFSKEEMDRMLVEFRSAEEELLHDHFNQTVDGLENARS